MKIKMYENKRMLELAGLLKENQEDEIMENEEALIGAGIGAVATMSALLTSLVSTYKKMKKENPEMSEKDLIMGALSDVANRISNAR